MKYFDIKNYKQIYLQINLNMKYVVVPNSCRVCLRKKAKLRSIFLPITQDDEPPPNVMFSKITGIALEEADNELLNLPQRICKSCELSLNLAYQFRSRAIKSQRIIEIYCNHQLGIVEEKDVSIKEELHEKPIGLHESLDEDFVQPDQLKAEMKVEALEITFSDEDELEYLEESYLELDVQDDVEKYVYDMVEEIPSSTDIAMNTNTSKCLVVKNVSSKEFEQHEDTLKSKQINCKRKSPKYDLVENSVPKCNKEALKQCLVMNDSQALNEVKCEATPTTKQFGKRCHKSATKRNEESHICDICGNIFAQRGRMMQHRRRHDKELRFACEICDKRFQLREKLRKHLYSHKGGKPFKCSFCSRSFFYESVKKAHEVIHSGHKPYVCETCNKAFAYSHALKKHKLIHGNIKLYHCSYCDKDFRLQHHMKQHEESKLHQNAVRSMEETTLIL